MPIYEYGCQRCGHELEAFQKIADAPLCECPACGEPALQRKISPVGFRLKGSGWYETDFKSSDKKKNLVKDDTPPAEASKPASGSDASKTADSAKSGKSEATAAT